MSDWQHPNTLAALRDADRLQRQHAWQRLIREPPDAAALPAVEAALAHWPDHDRHAPASCFARIEERPATGPHDPGGDRFIEFLQQPRWPWPLARHASFEFEAGFGAAALQAAAAWPPLRQLRSLALSASHDSEAQRALIELLRSPGCQSLNALSLDLGGIAEATLLALGAALPAELQSLQIRWVERGLNPLLAALLPARPALTRLSLQHCRLDVAALARSGGFDRLQALQLHGAGIDDGQAHGWAQRRASGALRELDIEDSAIDGQRCMQQGLIELIDAGWLDGLQSLRLGYHPLGGALLQHALDHADWRQLHTLKLWVVALEDADAERLLAQRDRLPALLELEVQYSQLGHETERRLQASFSREGRS